MAKLRATEADSVRILTAAVDLEHAVRKQEFDAGLATKAASGHTHVNDHVAATIAGGIQSLSLSFAGQALTGEVRLAASSGLEIHSTGLRAIFGTAAGTIAQGNHVHANDHVAASANPTQSTSAVVTVAAGQLLSCAVVRKANGGILVDAQGIYLDVGTGANQVSAGNHTHANATTTVAGFMSAADKTKLDGLPGSFSQYITAHADTPTIDLTVTGTTLSAAVKVGTGLVAGAASLQVDFAAVAAFAHVHANATTLVAGFMSAADKTKLDGIAPGAGGGFITSIADTSSIDLNVNANSLTADLRLAASSGLEVIASGVRVKFGSGAADVAAGNHTHANDHVAASANPTQSTSAVVTVAAGQLLSCAVVRKANGGILVDAQGLYLDVGTGANQVSAGNHVHANATTLVAGFMSATDKTKLDALPATVENPLTFNDTTTIDFTRSTNTITAAVKIGSGLVAGVAALEVDFTAVAAFGHAHSNATNLVAGFMSAADKTKLDALLDVATNDARYVTKAGSATSVQEVDTVLTADGGDAATPGLNVTRDAWVKAKLKIGATDDTVLYRAAVGELKIDTDFTIGGTLKVAGLSAFPSGSGSPEGVVTALIGRVYVQTTASQVLWFKVSGSGNTGWIRIPRSSVGSGAPEALVVGSPGDRYLDTATDTQYVKKTGSDTDTGWV